MNRKLHVSFIGLLFVSVVIGVIVLSTNPDRIGPVGVTVFFFLIYLWFFALLELVSSLIKYKRRKDGPVNPSVTFVFTATLAGIPPMLLALNSIGQLGARDIIFVTILLLVIMFYWSRR